jgi:hypothetical protein
MLFKVNDLIILTEKGTKYYCKKKDEVEDIYCVSRINKDGFAMFAYSLNDKNKNDLIFICEYFRFATESEVKTYKLKNMFRSWGN